MTVGLPGAGIGGLFYLASTLLLPLRSLGRWIRGDEDTVSRRQLGHSTMIAVGIIGGLWLAGWLLGFVMPDEMLRSPAGRSGASAAARTVIPAATFATAVATLVVVLLVVELARYRHGRRSARNRNHGPRS